MGARDARGFKFSVKASRFSTNRRVLAEGKDSINRFLGSGVTELGDRLGPLLWQFAPTKKFDEADFRSFLELLPEKQDGLRLRHVVEVRHDSFRTPEFVALLREFNAAVVLRRARDLSGHCRRHRPTSSICACKRARTP